MKEKKEKKVDQVEVEAKTVDRAIKMALKELKATEEEVSIQILKEEQKGLFGMQGAETAKVKVSLEKKSDTPLPGPGENETRKIPTKNEN